MKLSRLRLQGFKSFVDPTELVIAPGLTGIVGPNGCGKSNLLEALRWVMGENRPTAMRGGGMEDVIFAGAASRPARNFAEVTLTLENDERTAPAPFTEEPKIDVIRRITRDAGSVYRANGKETRARDIQMLFADASTGAHSPALVRQGQISELINAKPKMRRRILEEAAGISGLYQRRHEAELKLGAAETNLARVEDVLSQLDQRLTSLARQARQAVRYREIAEDLRRYEALLLYLVWKDASEGYAAAEATLTETSRLAARAETDANAARRGAEEIEAALPARREEDAIASAVLQRLQVERDTLAQREEAAAKSIADLEAQVEQLATDRVREETLNKDADETLERLEWETKALAKAAEGHDSVLAQQRTAALAANDTLLEREAEFDRLSEDAARLTARYQAAERRQEELQKNIARLDSEKDEAARALDALNTDLASATEAVSTSTHAVATTSREALEAADRLAASEVARAEAQTAEAERRAGLSGADGEVRALEAEASTLEALLAQSSEDGGQMLDQIRVAPGYEAALGAALAEDLSVGIADQQGGTGWTELEPYDQPGALPVNADLLANHVEAPTHLGRRLAAIGIVAQDEGAILQPGLAQGQRLVSMEGDLWRWDGLCRMHEDAPNAAAQRLKQRNQLDALQSRLTTARDVKATAAEALAEASARLDATVRQDGEARAARRNADEAANTAARELARAEAALERMQSRGETLRTALERREADATVARTEQQAARDAVAELGDLEDVKASVEAARVLVEGARLDMLAARARADETQRDGEARVRREREIATEQETWSKRQGTAKSRIDEIDRRAADSASALQDMRKAPEAIATQRAALSESLSQAEERRKTASDTLTAIEHGFRQASEQARNAERTASEARETRARAEAMQESARDRLDEAGARLETETGETADTVLAALDLDPMALPGHDACEIEVARLRRQRDALGAVNLRAEEDAAEVTVERNSLSTEKLDLEAAITRLRQGIAALNQEGRERLLNAFDAVNRNFSTLFNSLFGGGEANLVLVESEDPLDAGLEIMCMPPGKKLATLSLLSGGEQTLTAISLIFAVFLVNPSPICVLDEVDAPLDDANVTRFCDLLDEMTRQTTTRFMIITHHAVTMSRMNRLFGVTMAEQGVSQLVSVDLQQAESLVDG